jgi:hypothetical protein
MALKFNTIFVFNADSTTVIHYSNNEQHFGHKETPGRGLSDEIKQAILERIGMRPSIIIKELQTLGVEGSDRLKPVQISNYLMYRKSKSCKNLDQNQDKNDDEVVS